MISLGLHRLDDYLALLTDREDEAPRLAERISIKVSRFYRNAPAFDRLRNEILPGLARMRGGRLSVWSIGCGYGEETYTLAMLLAEAGIAGTVEATDIDESALRRATLGEYGPDALAELAAEWREAHLEPVAGGKRPCFRVNEAIRQLVRFSRHDLTSESPAPGDGQFDIVACRNVLIYLDRKAQEKAQRAILARMTEGGVLFLGEAEWPSPPVASRLDVIDGKHRLFRVRTLVR